MEQHRRCSYIVYIRIVYKVGRIHENTERFLYHIECCVYSLLIQKKNTIRIDGSFAFAFFSSFLFFDTFQRQTACSVHYIETLLFFPVEDRTCVCMCFFSYNQRNYIWWKRHTPNKREQRIKVKRKCVRDVSDDINVEENTQEIMHQT